MKKHLTLIASVAASATMAFADTTLEDAFWIIQDGKLTGNATEMPYDDLDDKVPSEMKDTVVDGENVVVYKQITEDYLDLRLQFAENVDLSKNYTLLIEYKIPESHSGNKLIDGNKPLFILGLTSNVTNLEKKNAPHSDAIVFVDGKWGPVNQWVTVKKHIYAVPSVTSLAGMVFSYAREYIAGDLEEFPYIKNLAFLASDTEKPFYAENFDGYDLGEFYQEKNKINKMAAEAFCGGIKPVITEKDKEYFEDEGLASLLAFRDFVPDSMKGSDGSGYIDCEILHALQVETNRDSIVIPNIQIPAGCSKIFSRMLIKKHKNEGLTWVDADYSTVENIDMPILVKFNTGEVVDLARDTIKLVWTKFYGEVDVPAGATALDLILPSMKVGYLVDEIMLSPANFSSIRESASDDSFEIQAYIEENGHIVVLNGDLLAVYNLTGGVAAENDKAIIILVKNDEGKLYTKKLIRK